MLCAAADRSTRVRRSPMVDTDRCVRRTTSDEDGAERRRRRGLSEVSREQTEGSLDTRHAK